LWLVDQWVVEVGSKPPDATAASGAPEFSLVSKKAKANLKAKERPALEIEGGAPSVLAVISDELKFKGKTEVREPEANLGHPILFE
jgi:hypothetical protein